MAFVKTGIGAGRKRLSDEEKKLRGTYKPCRAAGPEKGALMIEFGEPIMPLKQEGMDIFRDVCQVLIDYKMGKAADVYMVSIIAKAWEDYLEVVDLPTVEYNEKNGLTQPSGAFKVRKACESTIMDGLARLGVPPPARMKLRAENKEEEIQDEMEKFM